MVRSSGQRIDLSDVPPAQRIYVNRNLRLGNIQAIGFDMDHTLARYKPLPFERLAFKQAALKLVAAGYPRVILRLAYDREFVIRGLIVDRRRGNILKIDRHHYAVMAYHGTRKIPPEMRKGLYARRRIRIGSGNFVSVDSLFSLPEISLYAQLVDHADRTQEKPDYRKLYDDVRHAMDLAHADESIKSVIAQTPMRYLRPDPLLAETLDRMRVSGIRLFLLTNSEAEYTALIMDRLLSGKNPERPHWTDYFDLVVVRARKPGFFGRTGQLRPISPAVLGLGHRGRRRFAYTGGCVHALEKALRVQGDRILYFGDHTYGDILRSKRLSGWRTALIVQVLEEELEHLDAGRELLDSILQQERTIDQLAAQRDLLERVLAGQVPVRQRAALLKRSGIQRASTRALRQKLEEVGRTIHEAGKELGAIEDALETTFNRYWGPVFRTGREISHFANQVEEFACIYTTRVSNFLNYPMDKYFVATHVYMPHEQ